MADEQELELNPDPIVGVQGPATPPLASGRQNLDGLEQRRRNRFGRGNTAVQNQESKRGGFGFQEKSSEETSEETVQSQPASQESSGEPGSKSSDQAVQGEVPRQEVGHPNEGHVRQPPRRRFGAAEQVKTTITNQDEARSFAESMDNLSSSTLLTSMPHTAKASLLAIRKWHQIPDETADNALLSTIDPNMIALIMQIIQQVIACIPNHKQMGWSRIVNYSNAKPMERLGDNLRLNHMINKWADALAIPRESGDVVMIREAITQAASSLKMEEFTQVQTEVLFLTI
jgi:hypothetical protein